MCPVSGSGVLSKQFTNRVLYFSLNRQCVPVSVRLEEVFLSSLLTCIFVFLCVLCLFCDHGIQH